MAASETNIAMSLSQAGFDVTLVHCGGLVDQHCGAMSEAGLTQWSSKELREQICNSCTRRAEKFVNVSKLSNLSLSDFYRKGSLINENKALEAITLTNWMDFEIEGLPIGRYASYEFFLENKLPTAEIPSNLWKPYLNQLRNVFRSYIAWKNLLETHHFDGVVLSNELYSINRVAKDLFRREGLFTYTLGHGLDLRQYGNSFTFFADSERELEASRDFNVEQQQYETLDKNLVDQVKSHFVELSRGNSAFAYSSRAGKHKPPRVRALLNLDSSRKTILVLLSSLDERLAAEIVRVRKSDILKSKSSLFRGPIDWLRFILTEAERHQDLQFIFRLHPRMFPNKREAVESPAVQELKTLFDQVPNNVKVNWPGQNISLYDLSNTVDCVLNHTSSSAVEMMALGLPVIQHDPDGLFAYPASMNITATTKSAYFDLIRQAISQGRTWDNVANAYRFKAWQFSKLARNVSNGLPNRASWTPIRVINGLTVRKRWWFLSPYLHWLENRELKGMYVDQEIVQLLEEVVGKNQPSLASHDVKHEGQATSGELVSKAIISAYENMIIEIFGRNRSHVPYPGENQ